MRSFKTSSYVVPLTLYDRRRFRVGGLTETVVVAMRSQS